MRPLFILDEQEIFRFALRKLSEELQAFSLILDFVPETEWKTSLTKHPSAVVILDYAQVNMTVEQFIVLGQRFPDVNWILFSENLNGDLIYSITTLNKNFNVAFKGDSLFEVRMAIRNALNNEQFLSNSAQFAISEYKNKKSRHDTLLTVTEKEILKSIAFGKSTKQIAEERFSSVHTIMTHRRNIFRKLNVNNACEASRYALKLGLISDFDYSI